MNNKQTSLDFIEIVAHGLGELNEKSVFVGGATVPFYLPPEMKAAARATEDVDVILEIINPVHREKYEELLRHKGFKHDQTQGAPLCRWKFGEVTVDIMSPNPKIFGFSS